MSNTKALLSAQYAAEQMGKELALAFWLRDNCPNAAAYQLTCARDHFDALVKRMAEIDLVITDEAPPEEMPF